MIRGPKNSLEVGQKSISAFVVVLTLSMTISACSDDRSRVPPLPERVHVSQLREMEAIEAARAASRQGEYRLLGVRGYAIEIPGTKLTAGEAKRKYGLTIIEGTGDGIDSKNGANPNWTARNYAKIYNIEIIRLRGERMGGS